MVDDPEVILVLSTVGSREEGEKIGSALVERGEAACVNLVPGLTSIFRWQGVLCRESEVLLLAKTLRSRFPDLLRTLREHHSYELPEVIAVPVTAGLGDYLRWVEGQSGGKGGDDLGKTDPHLPPR